MTPIQARAGTIVPSRAFEKTMTLYYATIGPAANVVAAGYLSQLARHPDCRDPDHPGCEECCGETNIEPVELDSEDEE